MELQTKRRIQPHWHCLVAARHGERLVELVAKTQEIRDLWLQSLGGLAKWRGARHHAADVAWHEDVGFLWYRYLVDHASKSGGAQEAVGWGRHWGIINRKAFEQVGALRVDHLTPKEYAAMRRTVAKGQRWVIRDGRCVFGSRKSRASRRGSWGVSAWFGNASTFSRIVEWSKQGGQSTG